MAKEEDVLEYVEYGSQVVTGEWFDPTFFLWQTTKGAGSDSSPLYDSKLLL